MGTSPAEELVIEVVEVQNCWWWRRCTTRSDSQAATTIYLPLLATTLPCFSLKQTRSLEEVTEPLSSSLGEMGRGIMIEVADVEAGR